MKQMVLTAAAVTALAVAAAIPAYADTSIDEVVSDGWEITCKHLSREFTGSPAGDLEVMVSESQSLASFYGISMHDASSALGQIIGLHCPQFAPNVNAATKWAKDNDR